MWKGEGIEYTFSWTSYHQNSTEIVGVVHIANWDKWKEVIWIKFFAGKVIDVVKELLFQMNDWGSIGSALGSVITFPPSVMVFKEQEGENILHERILKLCLQGREGGN